MRISLTRSYRSPPLSNLIARPTINTRYPVPGPNTPTQPDRAGNPDLKPELATGVDIAIERYLAGSGLLSANVFRRNIKNYMRAVTTLETVSYASLPRYVLRQQNVGDAVTQGLELEAKFRASDVWEEAPRIDVRANASFFRSRVKEVPGPDNRLDQQPDYTANLGLDYRFRGLPLTLGGNLNWTPGLHDAPDRTCRPRPSAASSSSMSTACGPSARPSRCACRSATSRPRTTSPAAPSTDRSAERAVRETSQTRGADLRQCAAAARAEDRAAPAAGVQPVERHSFL